MNDLLLAAVSSLAWCQTGERGREIRYTFATAWKGLYIMSYKNITLWLLSNFSYAHNATNDINIYDKNTTNILFEKELIDITLKYTARLRNGQSVGLGTKRSRKRLPAISLSPIWYWSNGWRLCFHPAVEYTYEIHCIFTSFCCKRNLVLWFRKRRL